MPSRRSLAPVLLALAATLAPAATARTVVVTGRPGPHSHVRFAVAALRHRRVASALVERGAWRATVGNHRLARAARRGVLVVTVPRGPGAAPVLVVELASRAHGDRPARAAGPAAPPRDTAPSPAASAAPPATAPPSAPAGPAPGPQAVLQPPSTAVLGDTEAAGHVRLGDWEPRPQDTAADQRVPTAGELATFRADAPDVGACNSYWDHVTGGYAGTTDEIVQWVAWKWGLDEDIVRAQAAVETWWDQTYVGDQGQSFGLMQIKRSVHTGTYPLSADSTAFNLDYYAAVIRQYYDGCAAWLNRTERGRDYGPGDIWGAVGAWFAGRWHTGAADHYAARVQDDLAQRVWAQPSFAEQKPDR